MTATIKRKKIWIIVGAAVALLAVAGVLLWLLLPPSSNGLLYEERGGLIRITGYRGDVAILEIPAELDGMPVAEIAEGAFENNAVLKRITLPNTLVTIGARAFLGCTRLESITIPENVISIGNEAFYGCSGVHSISFNAKNMPDLDPRTAPFDRVGTTNTGVTLTVGASATRIPAYLFKHLSESCVKEIVFAPNSQCAEIACYAFEGNRLLTTLHLPASMKRVDATAFSFCEALAEIAVDEASPYLFAKGNCLIDRTTKTLMLGCNSSMIPQDESIAVIGSSAFTFCTALTEINIPSTVTVIEPHAFYGCEKIADLTLPAGLKTIGTYAFGQCYELISVKIPATVTEIGFCAFNSCTKLRSVQFEAPDGWTITKGGNHPETPLSASSLLELPTAASYLRKDYSAYYWKRSE